MSLKDGVVNPDGMYMGAFTAAYVVGVPITSYISNTGLVSRLSQGLVALVPGTITHDRTIPALAALYIFTTFGASAAFSVAGQAMGRPQGLDNNSPHASANNLTGLPLRLRSAHYNLMEMFPGFALAAALAYSTAPGSQRLINLLGLHVFLKTFVYYPAYVFDVAPLRSVAHLISIASVINVAWSVATGTW